MNKYIAILFVFMTTLFTTNALAFTPPPAPEKGWYVVDQTGHMTPAQMKLLNQKIERISKATKNEFGILALQDMGGDNIEDAANATFKAWGIGKRGLDNGVLIVVAWKERKTRIETGKGVEGEIPDLKASDILKQNLNPHLKQGDFYGGFDSTLDALSSYLESRQGQKADPPPAPAATSTAVSNTTPQTRTNNGGCDVASGSSGGFGIVLLLLAIGAVGLLWGRAHARRKRQEEEERQQRLARDRARRERIERENQERLERLRSINLNTPAVAVPVIVKSSPEKHQVSDFVPPPPPPVRTGPQYYPTRPAVPKPNLKTPPSSFNPEPSPTAAMSGLAAAAAASAAVAAAEATAARQRREREQEEERAAARRRREQEEREAEERRAEERRARAEREEAERQAEQRRQEESSRSSYSYSSYSSDDSSSGSSSSDSSSSFDWGGSSGSDSGGGFGGGDSGGGGASSDF